MRGGDQAVRLGVARAVHVFLDEAQAALAVHGGQVHLAGFDRRQDDVRGLADLAVDDVHVDREQPARVDRADDRLDQFLARGARMGVHGVLHHVGAAVVVALELGRVERRLVVVVGPDVVHLAVAGDDQLVDIGRGPADMGVGRAEVAFLVAAETADAAAFAADIAGRQRRCSPARR